MLFFSLSFSADEIYDTVSGEIEKEAEIYIPEESEKTAENFGETLTKENASSFFDIKKLFSFFIKSVLSVFDEEKGMFLSLLGIPLFSKMVFLYHLFLFCKCRTQFPNPFRYPPSRFTLYYHKTAKKSNIFPLIFRHSQFNWLVIFKNEYVAFSGFRRASVDHDKIAAFPCIKYSSRAIFRSS